MTKPWLFFSSVKPKYTTTPVSVFIFKIFSAPLIRIMCIADLVRTRDPAVLATCSVVVDVGGIYDESKQRFDHHQRGFTEVFGHGFVTKLSSAGLVYK